MSDFLQFEFMRNALAAALLASVACGIVGTFVVVRRLVSISGGIAHAAFGGIGLGYFLGINPVAGAIPFSVAAALGIGYLSRKKKLAEDTSVGIFWAMGMAIGVILIGLAPGYAPDLMSYLFGNILTVPRSDLVLLAILDALLIGMVAVWYKELLAVSFDEEFASVAGVRVTAIYLLLLSIVALTVVLLVRIVGIVLVIALLTVPAAIAQQYQCRTLKRMMIVSALLGMVFTLSGLWVSYRLDLASGATIIILAGAGFAVSTLARKAWQLRARFFRDVAAGPQQGGVG